MLARWRGHGDRRSRSGSARSWCCSASRRCLAGDWRTEGVGRRPRHALGPWCRAVVGERAEQTRSVGLTVAAGSECWRPRRDFVHLGRHGSSERCALSPRANGCATRRVGHVVRHYRDRPFGRGLCAVRVVWPSVRHYLNDPQCRCCCAGHLDCRRVGRRRHICRRHHRVCFTRCTLERKQHGQWSALGFLKAALGAFGRRPGAHCNAACHGCVVSQRRVAHPVRHDRMLARGRH